ncbi:MAG: DUF262 domain-containing protein [Arcobacter sp.]|nr:DUF262 domain-containing protein [Arcobacter sp.]
MIKLENKNYTFWELLTICPIKIPIIQRDYAQGRDNNKIKSIRENFLSNLFEVLEGGNKTIDLDFVYGTIKDDSLIPLDGQQRLTTLFLLHYYLCLKDKKLDRENKDILQKFTYETRLSSREFCFLLIEKDILEEDKKLSSTIKDQSWFFSIWENDPTIKAMLIMLDSIEEKCKNTNGFFEKLIDTENKPITFSFLNLDDFSLTDELYIKMNARGKPLSDFENFKSKFEECIEDSDIKEKVKIKSYIDNRWFDIFWDLSKKEVKDIEQAPKLADKMFYNFFYNATFNFFIYDKKENDNITKQDEFTKKYSLFDFYKKVYDRKNDINVQNIIDILNKLVSDKNLQDEYFKDFVKDMNISYWERARFYALSLAYIKNLDEREFKRWKRVSFNLINNQLIQSPSDLIKTIKSLKSLIDESNKNIYEYIKDNSDNIEYFTKRQRTEESLKAKLIKEDYDWENELIKAEKDEYLDGQIGFLLKFSKDDKGYYNLDSFKLYRGKFIALWDFLKQDENKNLIRRALLTKGDYLPESGSSNHTFCSFQTALRTKEYNWRKVFNDEEKRKYLKELLDDKNFHIENIKESLELIIENSSVNDYRKYFIENKDYIEYCENLFIRKDGDKIYLLRTTQMNGYHRELYSWDLFVKKFKLKAKEDRKLWWRLESDSIFIPFQNTWYYESTSWENPCIVLDDFKFNEQSFKLDIGYEKGSFYCLFYVEGEEIRDEKIIEVLKQKFNFQEGDESYKKTGISYDAIVDEVNILCEELNKLVWNISYPNPNI